MEERNPFSPGLFALIHPIIILSLVVPPTKLRPILFLLVLGISSYLLFYTTTGDALTDLSLASTISPFVAIAFDFIVLSEPQTQLFRIGQRVPSTSFASTWEKTKWALDLLFNQRGIGWTHEPSSHLPPSPFSTQTSRLEFIACQLFTAVKYFLMWDACAIYARNAPALMMDGPLLSEQPLVWKLVNMWAWAVPTVAALTISHVLFSAVLVVLGVWTDIALWKPLFGSFKEAYTVRKLWSRVWHQLLRRFLTTPGRKLRSYLSIPKGTFLSSYILLYTAFFISACIHHSTDYMMFGKYGGSLKFFIAQPLLITFEDFIIALGKRAGLTESRAMRVLGYVWVQLWFVLCVPGWTQPYIRAGLIENGMGPSLILGLWNGNWAPGLALKDGR